MTATMLTHNNNANRETSEPAAALFMHAEMRDSGGRFKDVSQLDS